MSSCANIVNRLQSDVCLIKENWSYIDYSALILKMNQGIFFSSPLLVYIIPNDKPSVIGIPLNVEVSSESSLTTTTYSALLVTDRFGHESADVLEYDSIVFTTETLINFGQRTSSGFFEITDTVPIVLIDADPSILPTLSQSEVIAALKSCAGSSDNHTVTWGPYDALHMFLFKNYGIKNLPPSVAACFYDYFNNNKRKINEPIVEKEEPVVYLPVQNEEPVVYLPVNNEEPVVYLPVNNKEPVVYLPVQNEESADDVRDEISVVLPSVSDITSSSDKETISLTEPEPVRERTLNIDLYETCVERDYPFEPFEPFEPVRDIFEYNREIRVEKVKTDKPVEKAPEIIVRHIEDSATTTTSSTTESSSNDAIEAKLRALLEATETSEVTRTE
jgi:hypothetical protein